MVVTRLLSFAVSGCVLLATLGTSSAAGEELWFRVLKEEAVRVASALRDQGFSSTHEPAVDMLRSGDAATYKLTLQAGRSYGVVAVCDVDCSALSLTVAADFAGKSRVLDSPRDVPMLFIEPSYSGRTRYSIRMDHCGRDPCGYAVLVFSQ